MGSNFKPKGRIGFTECSKRIILSSGIIKNMRLVAILEEKIFLSCGKSVLKSEFFCMGFTVGITWVETSNPKKE